MKIVLITLGSLALAVPFMRQYGMDKDGNLYGVRGTDSFMHWAFAAEMLHAFPPQNPLFAGEKLFNYHYGSDLMAAMVSKITGISLFAVLFQIMPMVYAFAYGITGWFMARTLKINSISGLFFIFLIYFGSSFSWIGSVLLRKNLSWNDALGVSQPLSYMDNQPLMLSLILLMLYAALLAKWLNKLDWRIYCGLIVLGILAPMTKVLVSVPIAGLLAGSLLALMIKKEWKKFWGLLSMGVISGVIGGGILISNSYQAGGLVWYPLQPLRRMIESPNFMEITNDVILRIQHYQATNNYFRLIWIFAITFLIYVFGNLGSRAVGILVFARKRDWLRLPAINYGLAAAGLLCGLIPMFWFLKTGGFNINQVLYYFLLLFSIPAAVSWGRIYQSNCSKLYKIMLVVLFLWLTLPGSWWTINEQMKMAPGKLDARSYRDLIDLGNELSGDLVIVVDPSFINDQVNFISAVSGRRVYLEALEYPRIQGHNVSERSEILTQVFGQINSYKYVSDLEIDLGVKNVGAVVANHGRILKMKDAEKWRSGELYDVYLVKK